MRNRHSSTVAVLLLLSACAYGPPEFRRLDVSYERCGWKICVHATRSRPSMNPIQLPFLEDPPVTREVLVPLKNLRTRDFRTLEDGWATDGQKVWCGRPDPEGALENLRSLGEHYHAIGTTVWFQCQAMMDDYGKPLVIHSFELLGCELGRIDGDVVSLVNRASPRSIGPAVDVQSFVIDDPKTCRAHDALHKYRIRYGWPERVKP